MGVSRCVLDVMGVSGVVLEPLRRQSGISLILVLENRTQNTPQTHPQNWKFAACFQGLQRMSSTTHFQSIKCRCWKKTNQKENLSKEITAVFRRPAVVGIRHHSRTESLLAGSWNDKSIRLPRCFARVARNAAELGFILEKLDIWPPRVAPGKTPLGSFFKHWKHSGKKTENGEQMC